MAKARICAVVCVEHAEQFAAALDRAAAVADLIELRLDCLPNDHRHTALRDLLHNPGVASRPLILTMRPRDQGGREEIGRADRLRFWSSLGPLPEDTMIDLELDLVSDFAASNKTLKPSQVICSQHDFDGVTADLDQIYERIAATGVAVLKIAVQVHDAVECLPVFRLLERAQREGRDLIAIAMGQAGVMTRILGPSRGSYLTYGSLDDESAIAPGQLTARQLREVYRIDRIDSQTEITGLLGKPVAHSISPHLHNAAFGKADMNAVFIPFEVADVDAFMRRMVVPSSRELDWNLRGFSVTAPHKTAVMKHLDWIEPVAKEIGAVNTIVVRDGALRGYNTDAAAFLEPLKGRFDSLENVRCAIIGAGGAARAIVWALQQAGASVSLFVREVGKGRTVTEQFKIQANELAGATFDDFDIVVNATPLGTLGDSEQETPATAGQLRGVRLAYDLVYNPIETRFMREARTAGCETVGGLAMLIAQAVEQFKLWTGRQPDIDAMRAAAERALKAFE
jgi:3-dehydroquinate dehydratase/shikimate dehydrogenase